MSPIIEVKHLTKEYKLGALTSVKDTLRHALARLTRKKDLAWERERFKALDDVSFSIEKGEVVGIIGHNGAGKSTLLKHLANIVNPTRGEVNVQGTVAPLIEVGAGLNPELTGRENIYLNGAILGISKRDIDSRIEGIIEFSELEQFIDTPVKRYSSGMTVKLGFSIATSIDADILIIDEVLAVGDLAFQRKCFDRMEKLIGSGEKTVLFVSHNIRQVTRMCQRVILLDHGTITADGKQDEVCNRFYKENNERILQNLKQSQRDLKKEGQYVNIKSVNVISESGDTIDSIESGDPLRIRLEFDVVRPIVKPEIVIGTHTTDFVYLTASSTQTSNLVLEELESGKHVVEVENGAYPLKAGSYGIRVAIFMRNREPLYSEENLCFFSVRPRLEDTQAPGLRLLNLDSSWTVQSLN